ncbi:diguanylate cyclase [bacterium]|nr:diguanylate cyclase [bacterium]MCP5462576.1 diguanylate cyclase [bacterium]
MNDQFSSSQKVLELVKTVTQSINREFTCEEILHHLIDITKHRMHVQMIAVVLFDEKSGYLRIKASRGLSQNFMTKFERNDEVEQVGKLIHGGESILINAIDKASSSYADLKLENDYNSVMAARVTFHAQALGYIICQRHTDAGFEQNELLFLEIISQLIATALINHRLSDENKALTVIDKETELYTFKFFCDRLNIEFERAKMAHQDITILLIDIDHFKVFCRSYGDEQSIELLRKLVEITRHHLAGLDLISRYGRDQITIALINKDENCASAIAQDICDAFSMMHFCGTTASVSIGVYHCPPDRENDITAIYNNLGMTLFDARYHGGNRVCKWSTCIYGDTR